MRRLSRLVAVITCAQIAGGNFLRTTKGRARATVRKPLTDHRNFEFATFDNGLTVLAVQDPKAAKAGMAVAVGAGSFYDPPELPGLAHFCEHLLFLGTRKYPDEASFNAFLAKMDGSGNAYTEPEHTVFYNEISHEGFEEGMDRFAQFFIAPLFKPELVGREVQAVNSEHEKNIPNQGRRLWELMRSTAREGSVVGKFYTGTVESLMDGNKTAIDALKKYHRENYCATRMHLVTVSNLTLAEQMSVAHRHFDDVPRGTCKPVPTDFGSDKPFSGPESLGQFIELHSDSMPQLWMQFPMPPTLKDYKAVPSAMLDYTLTYAGPKSLKSHLKEQDLISSLQMQMDATTAVTNVFLVLTLTPKGEADVKGLTSSVFDYLSKVRGHAKKTKLKKVYTSIQQMGRVSFDYQDKPGSIMETVSSLAIGTFLFAPEDTLSGNSVIDTVDTALVEKLMGFLHPGNVNLVLATQKFDKKRANQYEKWYKVDYARNRIPADIKDRWASPQASGKVSAPPPMMYVPSDLALLNASAGDVPVRVEQSEQGHHAEVWWLGRGRGLFPLPKVQIRLRLGLPPALVETPEQTVLRRLHVELTNQVLEEPMEDLGNCDMSWKIDHAASGYIFEFGGYSQHIESLVHQVTDGFAKANFSSAQFNQTRQKILEEFRDTSAKMPYSHAMDALSVATTTGVFCREDEMHALEGTDEAKLRGYIADVQKRGVRAQLVASGNLDSARAGHIADGIVERLRISKVLPKGDAFHVRVLDATRPVEVRIKNPIPNDANNAVVNSYQYGVPDVAQRVKLQMLGRMVSNPVYNTLRTREQLGYVVFGLMMPHVNVLELQVIVQGAKKDPDAIDGRIEGTLDDFSAGLKNFSEAEFATWKQSLRSEISKEDQNMAQEVDRFFAQVVTDGLCFHRKELELQYLDTLKSPKDVTREFGRFRHNPKKISVRLFGSKAANLLDAPKMTGVRSLLNVTSAQNLGSPPLVMRRLSASDKVFVEKGQHFFSANDVCTVLPKAAAL